MTTQETIAQLQAEIKALKASQARSLSLRVSPKGAVSLYGLGKWPVTLYKTQWESLLGKSQEIQSFLKTHESELAVKGQAETN